MASHEQPFRFQYPVPVRFRDIDVGGHAHHSMALVYFEEARAAYWREVVGRPELEDIDYILAEATVRYHMRVLYPDTLTIGVRVNLLGRKHFVMEYDARSTSGERVASGETVQVMYDYRAGRSKPIPPEVRARIEAFEGLTRGQAGAHPRDA
ncbi:MAG: acyl-CoA thioesterase [Gemmatimonadetes bacterium]|nr:acyl-CoA thioesterase [Gemmatimonadota bacterium]